MDVRVDGKRRLAEGLRHHEETLVQRLGDRRALRVQDDACQRVAAGQQQPDARAGGVRGDGDSVGERDAVVVGAGPWVLKFWEMLELPN